MDAPQLTRPVGNHLPKKSRGTPTELRVDPHVQKFQKYRHQLGNFFPRIFRGPPAGELLAQESMAFEGIDPRTEPVRRSYFSRGGRSWFRVFSWLCPDNQISAERSWAPYEAGQASRTGAFLLAGAKHNQRVKGRASDVTFQLPSEGRRARAQQSKKQPRHQPENWGATSQGPQAAVFFLTWPQR